MKRLSKILFAVLLIFFSISVNASVNVEDRNNLENYGVNKKWSINESNKQNVLKTPLVDVSEKIYDFSNIISDFEEESLRTQLMNL